MPQIKYNLDQINTCKTNGTRIPIDLSTLDAVDRETIDHYMQDNKQQYFSCTDKNCLEIKATCPHLMMIGKVPICFP